jgi:hypothetical protein
LRVISAVTTSLGPQLISHLLKTLPLVGRQDLLQVLVGLLSNITNARL